MPARTSDLDAYLGELTMRLEAVRGLELVGVYVGGSYALGGYEHGRSARCGSRWKTSERVASRS